MFAPATVRKGPTITLATVLVPTHNHGPLLQVAVNSALRQTVSDIEVFIVLDGPTPATREAAIALQNSDERVRVFDNPKGARNGELHRHQALRDARGQIVCYLSDDDLWLPGHVANALDMLSEADFAHSLPTWVMPEGGFGVAAVDLASDFYRALLLGGSNRIPLTTAAHTLTLYHRLPHGWRTTPEGTATDLYMWQQILGTENVVSVSGSAPTTLGFPSPQRHDMTQGERLLELQEWDERLRSPHGRAAFEVEVFDVVTRDRANSHASRRKDLDRFDASHAKAEDDQRRATQEIAELRVRNEELVARHDEDRRQIEAAELERERLIEARSRADRQLRSVRSSTTWRLRAALLRAPGIGRAYKWITRR